MLFICGMCLLGGNCLDCFFLMGIQGHTDQTTNNDFTEWMDVESNAIAEIIDTANVLHLVELIYFRRPDYFVDYELNLSSIAQMTEEKQVKALEGWRYEHEFEEKVYGTNKKHIYMIIEPGVCDFTKVNGTPLAMATVNPDPAKIKKQ